MSGENCPACGEQLNVVGICVNPSCGSGVQKESEFEESDVDGMKKSLTYIWVGFLFYVLLATSTGLFAVFNIPYEEFIWVIAPTLGVIGSIFLMLGVKDMNCFLLKNKLDVKKRRG